MNITERKQKHHGQYMCCYSGVTGHFTKRITVLGHLSYEERLACLELDTLECLRLKADLTLYYKIMHNLTSWPIDRYFNMSVHSRHTRLTECKSDFYILAPFCHIL